MANSLRIFRLLGIDVYLHYSWFFIFLLLAYGLSVGFFPDQLPGEDAVIYWILGSASAALLFLSVLFHELSHSVVAKRNKIPVNKITLFFFGGVSHIEDTHLKPGIEFRMAIAGPLLSLFLGSVFFLISTLHLNAYTDSVVYYLFRINFILGFFNLVPGFPLDGGRAFRAVVWKLTGDIKRATKYAALGGRIFAFTLIALGVLGIIGGAPGALWFVLIGFFLLFLAKMSYQQILIQESLKGIKIKTLMDKDFVSLSPNVTLTKALENFFFRYNKSSLPIMKSGKLLGVVSIQAIQSVPKPEWPKTKISEIMSETVTAKPTDDAYAILIRMVNDNILVFPIVHKGKVIGMVSRDTLLNYMYTHLNLQN